jgi:3-dehydroquinate synthase
MIYRQQITVPFEYRVIFTRDLFAPRNAVLAEALAPSKEAARAAVFMDQGMLEHWPELGHRIIRWCEAHPRALRLVAAPMTVAGGEAAKNDITFVQRVTHQFQRFELCRHSYVMAVGGGAVLDAVGLAAAVFHRGLRLLRVPTTVLSQADSGVGVKTGINFDGAKNLIGTFAPPFAVLNDVQFLTTLQPRDWVGGLAEAFKVAVIKDVALLEELERLAPRLVGRDLEAMQRVVERSAVLHLEHIRTSGDPFESGSARPLDFGHWAAHKLEALTNYELRHGEAVAIGIALDLYCAARSGFITSAERDRVCAAIERCGLALWHPVLAKRNQLAGTLAVVAGLEEFRQHLGGALTLALPDGLGRLREVHELPAALIEEAVAWLRERRALAHRPLPVPRRA